MNEKRQTLWERISNRIKQAETFVIVSMTLVIGLLIFAEVIMRSVLKIRGISWLNEFSRYMVVLTTILGSSMAASENGHMVMDTLYTLLPARASYAVKGLVHWFCALFWAYIDYYAWSWTARLVKIGTRAESVKMPMYVVWIPVGFFLATMAVRYLVEGWKSFRRAWAHTAVFDQMNGKEM